MAALLCDSCAAGRHPHDVFVDSGEDAGCPRVKCSCSVVLPPEALVGAPASTWHHPAAPASAPCPTCGRP